jgi:hypothetical protein
MERGETGKKKSENNDMNIHPDSILKNSDLTEMSSGSKDKDAPCCKRQGAPVE